MQLVETDLGPVEGLLECVLCRRDTTSQKPNARNELCRALVIGGFASGMICLRIELGDAEPFAQQIATTLVAQNVDHLDQAP